MCAKTFTDTDQIQTGKVILLLHHKLVKLSVVSISKLNCDEEHEAIARLRALSEIR